MQQARALKAPRLRTIGQHKLQRCPAAELARASSPRLPAGVLAIVRRQPEVRAPSWAEVLVTGPNRWRRSARQPAERPKRCPRRPKEGQHAGPRACRSSPSPLWAHARVVVSAPRGAARAQCPRPRGDPASSTRQGSIHLRLCTTHRPQRRTPTRPRPRATLRSRLGRELHPQPLLRRPRSESNVENGTAGPTTQTYTQT
mmetsp:Transcript_107358/g.342225  ORF Transcript_107358/g.342225 Transcript_107358/m.342225 type:complete len:200 (+) Transcript_107358:1608-2207(+)